MIQNSYNLTNKELGSVHLQPVLRGIYIDYQFYSGLNQRAFNLWWHLLGPMDKVLEQGKHDY